MSNLLESYLTYEFHKEYSQILYETCNFHFDFLNQKNHLLLDARNFPNVEIKLKSPKKLSKLIPEKYFSDYISYTLAYDKVCVYLFSNDECFIFCQQNKEDEVLEKITKAQKDTEAYLKAYENGLVKEAYLKARKEKEPVIFSIINGEAKLINVKDVEELFRNNSNKLGEFEDWELVCCETNPTLVSFLYIDVSEDKYWYDVLSEEYEYELFEKWGLDIDKFYDD